MKVTPVGQNFNKHKVGEVFVLPDKLATALVRLDKLREVTEDVVAETSRAPAKRTYRRRDLRAES